MRRTYWACATGVVAFMLLLGLTGRGFAAVCGDGKVEGYEECDNASANSDRLPDSCRSNCTRARCGDGVTDSDEQCDDYSNNSDQIPNACRRDCRAAHCGDGVLDSGEECDDRNGDPYDGCHQCQRCYLPKDDLVLSGDGAKVRLCPGKHELSDSGQPGVIIITGRGMLVDCDNAVLTGKPASVTGKGQLKSPLIAAPKTKPGTPPTAPTPNASPSPAPGTVARILKGIGVVVLAPEVVLHNCRLENFSTGISLKSSGAILFNNQFCGNTNDLVADNPGNFGVQNMCALSKNWQENGSPGCSAACPK